MKIYLSGALAGARDLQAARRRYERLAEGLSAAGINCYLPHTQADPEHQADMEAGDVFARDMEQLLSSDAVLALLDEPSLGVGAEVALAVEHRILVFAVWHKSATVSRFIRGLLKAGHGGLALPYESHDDIVDLVVTRLCKGA